MTHGALSVQVTFTSRACLHAWVDLCSSLCAKPTGHEQTRRWRAQAATYLLRPNARTLAAVARRRTAAFAGRSIAPGTISVHVRKGDKWVEAEVRQ